MEELVRQSTAATGAGIEISARMDHTKLTMNVAMRWLMADPAKAEKWVRGSVALSAEQREAILTNGRLFRGLSGADAGK